MPDKTLAEAYKNVFGHGDDADRVLADLAQFTGFYATLPSDATVTELAFHNGARTAFGRIYQILSDTDEGYAALDKTAR